MEMLKGKPHLEVLLRGRRWARVGARIKNVVRLYGSNGRRERIRRY